MGIVQYIIIRKDLIDKHGIGFLASQTAHASLSIITKFMQKNPGKCIEDIFDCETLLWINGTFTKIVLEVPNEYTMLSLCKSLEENSIEYSRIRESRLNGELTAIGLKPYEKETVYKFVKDLKLLN